MMAPKRVSRLVLVMACLASGCVSSARYPFREKPVPPTAPTTQPRQDAAHLDLEKELGLYSD